MCEKVKGQTTLSGPSLEKVRGGACLLSFTPVVPRSMRALYRKPTTSNQEVEDAEPEQIERDADVTEVIETRQHSNTQTTTQHNSVQRCNDL